MNERGGKFRHEAEAIRSAFENLPVAAAQLRCIRHGEQLTDGLASFDIVVHVCASRTERDVLHVSAKGEPDETVMGRDAKSLNGRRFAWTPTGRASGTAMEFPRFLGFFSDRRVSGGRYAMRRRRLLFALWTGVIILLVVPWGSFQDHAHWNRVGWLPFVSPPVRPGDVIRNVLLYVPWGYLLARQTQRASMSAWRVTGYALAFSLATEAMQVMSHGRFPSATDVSSNAAGAWIGGLWAIRRRVPR